MADFSVLDQAIAAEDFEKALDATQAILATFPEDQDAINCKIVALMHLGKFADAKGFIIDSKIGKKFWFELAYCHYREGDLNDTLKILESAPQDHVGGKQLRAQALFRNGEYVEAAKAYEGLVGVPEIDAVELRTNMCACYSAAGPQRAKDFLAKYKGQLGDSADLMYNATCALIESGDLGNALKNLQAAQNLAHETLGEEDATEEEIEDELCLYQAQEAYIQQSLGASTQALATYQAILKKKPSDVVVGAVVANNIIALKKDRDLFDSAKKAKNAIAAEIEKKLTYKQRKAFAFNRCLLLLNMNKIDQCNELAADFSKRFKDAEMSCLLTASIQCKSKNTDKGVDTLKNFIAANAKTCSVNVQLSLAQLLLDNSKIPPAIDILESINKQSLRVGVTSTIVRLYECSNNVDGALKVLNSAVEALNKSTNTSLQRVIISRCADLNISRNRPQQALDALEKLVALQQSKDLLSLCHVIKIAALVDPQKARQYASKLPAIPAYSGDVEALESAAAHVQPRSQDAEDTHAPVTESGVKSKRPMSAARKNKKKMKRLLKRIPNFDPSFKADPERWVAKINRANAKKGRKKGAAIKGSQGSTANIVIPVVPAAPAFVETTAAAVPAAARKKNRGR